jgi:hypothetical protein
MSSIRLEVMTAPPAHVEAELAALMGNCPQTNLAEAAGLTNNSRISRGISSVSDGSRDGFLEAFSAAKVLKWARAHGPLGDAVKRYIDGGEVPTVCAVESLRAEITHCAESIVHINVALADGKLTRTERARIAQDLRKAMDRMTRTVRALERA